MGLGDHILTQSIYIYIYIYMSLAIGTQTPNYMERILRKAISNQHGYMSYKRSGNVGFMGRAFLLSWSCQDHNLSWYGASGVRGIFTH